MPSLLRRRRPGRLVVPGVLALVLLAPLVPGAGAPGAAGTAAAPSTAADRVAVPADHDHRDGADGHGHGVATCDGEVVRVSPDAPPACAHVDVAPPGVDVTDPVTTAEAAAREGAFEAATVAAAELGVPTAVEPAATSSVRCDGDGTSGYRVQAMYVVEVGRPNRYAELLPSLRAWAAGADAVVNRSAALTGGVRDVRFVHEAGTADCQATVLNVTVPAGGLASFSASVSALQAQGHTDPARKYLMWADATVLCGVAQQYLDDQPGQENANNGSYPQYGRTDAGCWGGTYSVEAHELVHMLGGVQRSAPNASAAGHCTDESDRLCYVDGSGVVMRQVCPRDNEALLDCGGDDYFSTFPVAGSYLDTRWNSADSRFLVGGGDGSDGGQAGSPTRLGVSVQVNSPGLPGLPTQASATLQLPAGRSAGVVWRASSAGCLLGTPTAVQTSVTCPAASAGPVTLTVTATDSTGQTATAAAPLTFATSPRRTVTVAVDVAGATDSHTGCAGAPTPVRGTVVDTQSGVPVLGVPVELRRRTATTLAATVGTATTTVDGTASISPALADSQLWSARTRAVGPYDVATSSDVLTRTAACTATVTLEADAASAWAGDRVGFSGTVVRTTAAGASSAVAGGTVTLLQVQPGSSTPRSIGTARTDAGGAWTAAPVMLLGGPVVARLSAGPGHPQADSPAVPMTVTPTVTRLAASSPTLSTMYGSPVTVSGTLRRDEGGSLTPVAGGRVQVVLTRPGTTAPTALGTATSDAAGAWSLVVRPTVSGSLAASFAAVAGQPAARTVVGDLVVATWGTTTTMAASPVSVAQGGTVTTTGLVTRSGGGVTQPAPAVPVRLYLQPAVGGSEVLLGTATTRADGTYTLAVRPTQNGTLRARLVSVAGHAGSTSASSTVAVAARVTVAPSTRTPTTGVAFTLRATVTPTQAAPVRLEQSVGGGAWTQVQTATTSSTGVWTATVVPTAPGPVSYRVGVSATTKNTAATSAATAVTVAP